MKNSNDEHSAATFGYAVRVFRSSIASDGGREFERYVTLPFVPWVGLLFGFDSYDDSVPVVEVAYVVVLERFEIVLSPYDDHRDNIENIVEAFVKDGWAVVEA